MISRKTVWQAALAAAAVSLPVSASAGHIRAGLWEVSTHVDIRNVEAMIPPEQLARMKAMGMHLPGGGAGANTFRYCVSAADAAKDAPPPMRNKGCGLSNLVFNARTFTADIACTGEHEAHGHVSVMFDGDTHYTGSTAFNAMSDRGSTSMGSNFEGRWVSANCGSVE